MNSTGISIMNLLFVKKLEPGPLNWAVIVIEEPAASVSILMTLEGALLASKLKGQINICESSIKPYVLSKCRIVLTRFLYQCPLSEDSWHLYMCRSLKGWFS